MVIQNKHYSSSLAGIQQISFLRNTKEKYIFLSIHNSLQHLSLQTPAKHRNVSKSKMSNSKNILLYLLIFLFLFPLNESKQILPVLNATQNCYLEPSLPYDLCNFFVLQLDFASSKGDRISIRCSQNFNIIVFFSLSAFLLLLHLKTGEL